MTEELKLKIEGMHCDACVRRVSHALTSVSSVVVDEVHVGDATVRYDPTITSAQDIAGAINAIGFSVLDHTAY